MLPNAKASRLWDFHAFCLNAPYVAARNNGFVPAKVRIATQDFENLLKHFLITHHPQPWPLPQVLVNLQFSPINLLFRAAHLVDGAAGKGRRARPEALEETTTH
jgi:hypothetical protein